MGYSPARMVLIGCQPVELEDYGGGLRPAVAARIPEALAIARDILAEWPSRQRRPDRSPLLPIRRSAAMPMRRPPFRGSRLPCRGRPVFPGDALMCVGLPLRLEAVEGIVGRATEDGQTQLLDLTLLPDAQPGDWVLGFLGTAREILPEAEALLIRKALRGLAR